MNYVFHYLKIFMDKIFSDNGEKILHFPNILHVTQLSYLLIDISSSKVSMSWLHTINQHFFLFSR